jgi:hypothetical protein
MKNKVIVCGTNDGRVVMSTKNPKFGYIKVKQIRIVTDDVSNFARAVTIHALINGTIKDLESFGWKKDQEIEGTVIIKEQMEPFSKDDAERDLKIAGNTGIVCRVGNEPIYRKHFWKSNSNAEDVLIPHTNVEEIKAAYAELGENEGEGQSVDNKADLTTS